MTPRQVEIARLLALYSLEDAAAELEISVSTLRYHGARIYRILGAKSKRDLARILYERGML